MSAEFFLFCDVFFFKQKTAYEMRISDWSSDVCSSDLTFSGPSEEDFFFRTSRFSTLGLNARRSLCRRGVRLGDGVAEVPVEGRRVRINARDLDDTRHGEPGNAAAARPVRCAPPGTRAAPLHRGTPAPPPLSSAARRVGQEGAVHS